MRNSHVKEKQFPHVGKAIPSCGKNDSLVWEKRFPRVGISDSL